MKVPVEIRGARGHCRAPGPDAHRPRLAEATGGCGRRDGDPVPEEGLKYRWVVFLGQEKDLLRAD